MWSSLSCSYGQDWLNLIPDLHSISQVEVNVFLKDIGGFYVVDWSLNQKSSLSHSMRGENVAWKWHLMIWMT